MIIANTAGVAGYEITETLGLVRGNTVRARNLGRDFFAALRNVIGGEINEYTRLMNEARDQAVNRMSDEAMALGADAVVNVRFMTAPVMQGAAEIMAYGTAVKLKPLHELV